jgi:N-methylhydantoinase B
MAASGGFGDPYTRDVEAVVRDLKQEKITVRHALEAYGVVVDPATGEVDTVATHRYRTSGAR